MEAQERHLFDETVIFSLLVLFERPVAIFLRCVGTFLLAELDDVLSNFFNILLRGKMSLNLTLCDKQIFQAVSLLVISVIWLLFNIIKRLRPEQSHRAGIFEPHGLVSAKSGYLIQHFYCGIVCHLELFCLCFKYMKINSRSK